jgi:ABC-type branched-subunit amino acid transport system substrate-binding protein
MKRREFLKRGASNAAWVALAQTGVVSALGTTASTSARAASPLKVAVMIPQSGPAALFGPSSRNCSDLAAADLNKSGGVLGRPIQLLFGDAGAGPDAARQTALKLWKGEGAEIFVGMHDSAVRGALTSLFHGQIPYFYTASYEGGECSPGTYVTGETPQQQLAPILPWFAAHQNVKRWYLIGNDYVWPRSTNAVAKRYIANSGGTVVGEEYLPFSVDNFDTSLARIKSSGAQGVLVTLVGGASVAFNRAFASFGLAKDAIRVGTLIEENTLAGIGVENAANLYSSAGYFASLDTPAARAFASRYTASYPDPSAQLNSLAESLYDGFLMINAIAQRAGQISVPAFDRASDGARYMGPRGLIQMSARHTVENIYLAQVGKHGFEIAETFSQIGAQQTCRV